MSIHKCAYCGVEIQDPCSRTFANGDWLYFCHDCERSGKWAQASKKAARESGKQTRATAQSRSNKSVSDYDRFTLYAGVAMAVVFGLCFWL